MKIVLLMCLSLLILSLFFDKLPEYLQFIFIFVIFSPLIVPLLIGIFDVLREVYKRE
jgi:hypothetical protein